MISPDQSPDDQFDGELLEFPVISEIDPDALRDLDAALPTGDQFRIDDKGEKVPHFLCTTSTRFLEEDAGGFGELRQPEVLPTIEELVKLLPDVGPVEKVTQAQAAEIASQNYCVETKLGETVVVKRCGASATREHLEALHEVLQHLRKLGNDVPFMKSFDEEGVCVERDGAIWAAFSFIPAKNHFRGGSFEETKAVGQAIGKLDRGLATLSQLDPLPKGLEHFKRNKGTDHWLPHGEVQQEKFEELLELIKTNFKDDPYHQDVLRFENDIRYAFKVRDVFQELSRGEDKKVQFIHGDLHPQNILMTERGVAIIDFDLLMKRSIYTELGCALYHVCRAAIASHVKQYGEGSREAVEGLIREHGRIFLKEWKAEFSGEPMNEQEQGEDEGESPLLVARPLNDALRRVIYYLDAHYVQGVETWSFDIPAHLRGPREMFEILPFFCKHPLPERDDA